MAANTRIVSGKPSEDNSSISSVYSLAVQCEGLWLLSGLESGGINLQSVRVDEGKRIAKLQGHTSAVSVLNLAQDEQSVLSGSWDKNILDWDLNTGKIIRKFEGSGGQISTLETRPLSSLPVPEASGDVTTTNGTLRTDNENKPRITGALTNGFDHDSKTEPFNGEQSANNDAGSPADSLFGDSLFGDNENEAMAPAGGNFVDDEDDEFSRAIIANGMREQEQDPDQDLEKIGTAIEDDVQMVDAGNEPKPALNIKELEGDNAPATESTNERTTGQNDLSPNAQPLTNGLPHDVEATSKHEARGETHDNQENGLPATDDPPSSSRSTFLAASFDGSLRIWDKRQPKPIAKIAPQNVPPWCMNATWSPDGNFIYAGRRNGTVDEYSLHKGLRGAERSFKLPNNSGPVSALRAMPNGRHLIW